jgi:uncharacterized damage-inducible protein DinB
MDALLRDLYGHQAWADIEHWKAIGAHAPARDDRIIRERLHHLHIVQRSFMWAVSDRSTAFAFSTPADFKTFADLEAYARGSHAIVEQTLASLTDARLTESISMPWFKDPPLTITVAEALTQCAMHSQWHRGQNATRFRELGGTPPLVDLIIWYWRGRPAAVWD